MDIFPVNIKQVARVHGFIFSTATWWFFSTWLFFIKIAIFSKLQNPQKTVGGFLSYLLFLFIPIIGLWWMDARTRKKVDVRKL
jgi:glycerol-3-phosphate acyltransferase PlsY